MVSKQGNVWSYNVLWLYIFDDAHIILQLFSILCYIFIYSREYMSFVTKKFTLSTEAANVNVNVNVNVIDVKV